MERKVRELISKMLNVSQEDFDYEFDKVNRHPKKASEKNKKNLPTIICKLRTHQLKEHLFSKKKEIYNNINHKISFHINLTKYKKSTCK